MHESGVVQVENVKFLEVREAPMVAKVKGRKWRVVLLYMIGRQRLLV